MKKFLVSFFSLILFLTFSITAFADTKTSDSLLPELSNEQATIDSADNKFVFKQYVTENFDLKGDMIAGGYSVDLTGNTTSDVITFGNNIYITSDNIGGSIRSAGYTVNISAKSVKNITAAGSSILVNTETNAKGAYLFADSIEYYGNAEDLYAYGNTVYINGTISGNLNVDASKVTLGKDAKINGTIKITASENPTILGDIDENSIDLTIRDTDTAINTHSFSLFNVITKLISSFILGALLILISRKFLNKSADNLVKKPWLPFVIGLGVLVVLPIVALIVCFTLVGIPLSIISILIYGITCYLAPVVAGITFGNILLKDKNIYLRGLTGIFGIRVLILIPYLGGIVRIATALLTLGFVTLEIVDRIKSNTQAKASIE